MTHRRTQPTGSGVRCRIPLYAFFGLLAVAIAAVVGGDVRPAAALHYVDAPGAVGCNPCHTLDATEGEVGTSYINKASRTLAAMKAAYNPTTPTAPPEFGCTYCHNAAGNARMRGVLSHFSGKTSMHPVGKNFVTNADNSNEYLSTWSSTTANELDCVDCHDVSVGVPASGSPSSYPDHGVPPAANPFMLRNIAAAGSYDGLCRTCHGNSAPPTKGANDVDHNFQLTTASVHTDGNTGAGGSGAIAESDGTPLRPAVTGGNDQCRQCHDTHYSNNYKLFNDGHEGSESNLDVGTDCTSACHYNGDQSNNFETHGHGMNTSTAGNALNFNCTNCHTVNARHDSPYVAPDTRAAKMFAATPDTLFSSLTPTKSLTSICATCHGTMKPHQGTVGCLDCHDEHAEGSGAASNIFMIPQQLPNRTAGEPGGSEPTVFEHASGADFDYYVNNATTPHVVAGGVCDNGICHAGLTAGSPGVPISPLSGLMAGNNHTGGNIATDLGDCSTCHMHNDTTGSWGAAAGCTPCHGQPPVSFATQYASYFDHAESVTPHARHANEESLGGYNYDCRECHNNWTDTATHNTTPSTFESIWFDTTNNPSAAPYVAGPLPQATPDYDEASNTCSNIYCHSNGSSVNAVGTAVWMTGFSAPNYATTNLPCTACHNDGGTTNSYPADAAGNHARHVGKGVGCQNCHSTTTADGTSILVGNHQHVDREKDVVAGYTYNTQAVSFTWTGATKTCSALSCHSGRQFAAASIAWTTAYAAGWCTNCHNNGTNDGLLTSAWPPQGEHQLHAGAMADDYYAYPCKSCHPDNALGHSPLNKAVVVDFALNVVAGGSYYPDGLDGTPGNGDDATCDATYCHGSGSLYVPDWDNAVLRLKTDGSVTAAVDCNMCHGTAGQGSLLTATGRPNSPTTGGRHTGTTHATLSCTICHLNDNTDRALHAKGPAQTGPPRADAAMAATIDGATYTRVGGALTDQGFSFTNGTCADMTVGCHPSADWGQTAAGGVPLGCTLCHGDRVGGTSWPKGSNTANHYYDTDKGSHPEHIAALQAKEGFTLSQADQTAMCAYCHPTPGSATHRADTVGSLASRVDVIRDGFNETSVFSRIDGAADLTATADGHTAATYAPATLTCANIDCHYEKPTPAYAGLGWGDGDAQTPNCETCHFTRGTVGPDTYPTVGRNYVVGTQPTFADGDLPDSHLAHVAGLAAADSNASKSYPCSYCHTVVANTAHLNGSIDLSSLGNPTIDKDGNATDETITFAPPTATGVKYGVAAAATCANIYCHGADFSGAADGTGGTRGINTTPVWNDFTTGACGACHDFDTIAPVGLTQPLTEGAHGTHMPGLSGAAWGPDLGSGHHQICSACHGFKPMGTLCAACHAPHSGSGAGFVTEPSRSHVEGNFLVDFEDQDRGWNIATGVGSGTPSTLNGTAIPLTTATDICDGCHSTWDPDAGGPQLAGAATAKQNWATATRITNCLLCHNQAVPATSAVVSGGVQAPPKDAYYTLNGHGNSGPFNATLHNQNGPGFACGACHAENSAHLNGVPGEDRLDTVTGDALTYTTAKSEFCLDCHGPSSPGALGVNAVAQASVHSGGVTGRYAPAGVALNAYGNSGSYATNPGYQCDACHDPHGTGKLAMIRTSIDGAVGGVGNPVTITNFASAETDLRNLDPAAGTGAGQAGVCDACHLSGGNPHPDTNHTDNHNQGGSGDSCLVCHDHANSFVGSCTRCHGGDSAAAGNLNYWPGGAGAAYPTRTGEHNVHIARLATQLGYTLASLTDSQQKTMCAYCHNDAAGVGGSGHNDGGATAEVGDFNRIWDAAADTAVVAAYTPGNGAEGVCSNLDCHNNKPTLTTPTAYDWYDGAASACAMCHKDIPTEATHLSHMNATTTYRVAIGCASCHEATAWNVAAPATGHINGTWTMKAGLTYGGAWPSTVPGGGCGINLCHNDGKNGPSFLNGYRWGNAMSFCNSCHLYDPDFHTESHQAHLDATTLAGGGTGEITCTSCHAFATGPHIDGSVSFGGSTAFTYTGDAVVANTAGAFGSCGINACHNDGKNGTVRSLTYTWGTPIGAVNSCTECHGDDAASLTTQAHDQHLNAAALFGRSIACTDCHAAATTATHANGSVSFGGTVIALDATYTGDKVVSGTTYGTCGINSCHNDGTGAAPAVNPAWDTVQTDCTICHLNTILDTPMASNAHGEHMNAAPAYTGAACADCHTPQTAATHINGSTNFETLPLNATYSKFAAFPNDATASGTCLTASCHNRGAAQSAAWDIPVGTGTPGTNDLACNACHYYELAPTGVNNSAYFDPLSTSHNDHFDKSKLCVECHDTLPTTTAHITGRTSLADGAVAVDDEANVTRAGLTFSDGANDGAGANNTCSGGIGLGCHATGAPDWEVAFVSSACLNCHTDKTTTAVNPTSGLHGAVPRLSTNTHDEDWDADGADGALTADCTTCHTAAPSTGHTNGTLEGAPVIAFAAEVVFTDAATPTCGPNGTLVSCHGPTGATNGDAGTWRRLWSATVANSDGTECANCHGGMNQTDWTFGNTPALGDGSVEHERDWDGDAAAGEVSGNHRNLASNATKCNTCHVHADAPYATMGWAPLATSTYHGNGSIDMNSTLGYAEATYNCTSTCHSSAQGNTNHNLENSVWPVNAVAGPALGCTSCHGADFAGASSLNYWPGGTGTLYPNRTGEHNVHMTRLASQLGYTLTALTDPQQTAMCAYCHNDGTGVGGVGHNLGGATAEVGDFNRIWDAAADTAVVAAYTPGNGAEGVCSNLDCHNNKPTLTTPTAYDWYDGAASACAMCHKDIPTEATHLSHMNATTTYRVAIGCASCHEATAWNVAAPATGHLNGTWTMKAGLTYGGAWPSTVPGGGCGINLCHNDGKNGPSFLNGYRWGNAMSFCNSCHLYDPDFHTESHQAHLDATTLAGGGTGEITCTSCHAFATGPHIDGSVSFGGSTAFTYTGDAVVANTAGAFGSCGINACHNNGKNGTVRSLTYTWGIPIGAVNSCTECHGDDAASLTTQAHDQHLNAAALFGRSIACTDCHAAATTATHANGSVTLTGAVSFTYAGDVVVTNTAAPYSTCGTSACHNDGTGAAPAVNPAWDTVQADCTICHLNPNTAAQTGNGGARHVAHDDNNAWVPNDCGSCHAAQNNKTSMGGYATHINGAVTMAAAVTYTPATGACANACHLVGVAVPPVSANPGDWLDANPLACTDCHGGAYIGTPPQSGLHTALAAIVQHDEQFTAYSGESPQTATCTHCHAAAGPSSTHLAGSAGAAPPTQNSSETTYSFNNTYLLSYTNAAAPYTYPGRTGCQATCHTDYRVNNDAGGAWKRRWMGYAGTVPTATDLPGDQVCDNCHGDGVEETTLDVDDIWNWTETNGSTADHTDPYSGNTGDGMGNHNGCEACHGWGSANYNGDWGGPAPGHGDGFITMNGPDSPPGPVAGAQYDDATGGCAAACHSIAFAMNADSGWTANYGDFGAGNCENCHGNPPNTGNNGGAGADAPNVMGDSLNPIGTGGLTPKPYDNGTYGFNVNGHGADGTADNNPAGLTPNRACTDCHSLGSHHFDGVLDGVSGRANATRYANNYHLRTDSPSYIVASSATDWDAQIAFDNACWMRCHESISNFNDMRHAKDLVFDPIKNLNTTLNAVRFGDKKTVANGESIVYPVDSDITNRANLAADDFVTCATCHNVHGTAVVEPQKSTNRMVRDNFFESSELCLVCHQ